ncbi:MAG: hypothetical protein HZA88_12895 [Verrucomicrobia bacterium]|nr:hypothetical protein [Verrucomicrobiota bacterium]
MKTFWMLLVLLLSPSIACAEAPLRPPSVPLVACEKHPISNPQNSPDNSPKSIAAAKERGAAHAIRDIKAGKPRILYFGKPWSVGKPLVDDPTGYPVEIVGDCSVTKAFVAEVEAYNSVMRDWYAKAKPTEASKRR